MGRIRFGIDALTAAKGLSRWTHASAILTLRIDWTGHVAAAAILRIVHRVDACRAARGVETCAE